ncbi:MAG: rRNA processing protein RimM [Micavibrio sp.]|nr:rRNA processing protein RimM [Micavibrio sp.]
MTDNTKRILIGEISTAHGVRGLVKVRAYGDDPKTLEIYGPLYTSETGTKAHQLKLKHQAGGVWIAQVDEIDDRNIAETLRGTKLWLDRDKLPALEDGFYHDDLIGLSVIDEAGAAIGVVTGVDNFGAGDLLDIRREGKPNFYLPFADIYVLNVDVERKTVTVDIPDGLIDD